ncbi:PQQ-dependent sugar dehydrogenase [Pleionea mediterranea]|uniref:Glucose/arabinose dehydrogenase n=1 Tax=Pleionea mediterranea TaxID=523701 RepID=A0A316FV16_9GAMM|nr:PQQ-dependent sugar dehydrogenase [Pleionea mediterranea]PWK51905.1 glucose/arabinose dehydrogenase [Pleionea mediterranea]
MSQTIKRLMHGLLMLTAVGQVLFVPAIAADKATSKYQVETIIDDLNVPWSMVQLSDSIFLVTERSGQMYRIDVKTGQRKEVSGLPKITSRNQGGLLDIELHPDYNNNGWIYFSFASPEGEGRGDNTAIVRAKLKDHQLVEKQVVYKATPNSTRSHHYGSRIEFDRQGYLFFSIGDRGNRSTNPQNLSLDGGKIYRLHDDGEVPKDNPFLSGDKPAIYSYGHRNPQGMALHPETGDIWIHEHGPKGGDEINIVKRGRNYGWPVISYGVNYDGSAFTELTKKQGMEQPEHYWVPSIAPSGMTFVTSDKYPDWQGHLLVGSLKFGYLVLVKINDDNQVYDQEVLFEGIGRVRNVQQLNDGYIYVAVDGQGVKKLKPL